MKLKIYSAVIVLLFLGSSLFPVISSLSNPKTVTKNSEDFFYYGYIIEVGENDSNEIQIQISRLVNDLLDEKINVYWSAENITSITDDLYYIANNTLRNFGKGCFIVPFSNDTQTDIKTTDIIFDYYLNHNLQIYLISQSLNNIKSYHLKNPEIVYYISSSGDFLSYYKSLSKLGFKNHNFVTREDIINSDFTDNYDVFVHGGGWVGGYAYLLGTWEIIGPSAVKANNIIREFIKNGGGFIGSCAGLEISSIGGKTPIWYPFDLGSLAAKIFPSYSRLGIIDMYTHRALPGAAGDVVKPGTGVDVKIVDKNHPVSFGLPDIIENTEYFCGPTFINYKSENSKAKPVGIIGDVKRSDLVLEDWSMGFIPWWNNKLIPERVKYKKVDRWINCSIGQPIWASSEYGKGKAIAFGGHPETYSGEDPPRILSNSVFYTTVEEAEFLNLVNKKMFKMNVIDIVKPEEAKISQNISFSYILDENIESSDHLWNFGDNTKLNDTNPVHSYSEHGEYNIILTAGNKDNIFTNFSFIDIVEDIQVETNIFKIISNTENHFSADVKGGIKPYTLLWDFGDGSISNEQNPSHIYENPGIYKGLVTVSDSFLDNASTSLVSVVNNQGQIDKFEFDIDIVQRGNINKAITFFVNVNSSTAFYKFNFSFGDGTYNEINFTDSNHVSTTHCYDEAGYFYPTVQISDLQKKVYFDCKKIFINHPPNKPIIENNSEIEIGDSNTYIGEPHAFNITLNDPDEDKMFFCINWGKATYNYTIYVLESGETFKFRDIRMVEGDYSIKVKAVDEYGAESEWGVYNYTVKKGNIWRNPFVVFLRFLLKHPNTFPLFRTVFDTEIFEY